MTADPAADLARRCREIVARPSLAEAVDAAARLRADFERDVAGRLRGAARAVAGRLAPARPAPPPVEVTVDLGRLLLPAYDQVVLPWLREYGSWEPEEAAVFAGLVREGMTVLDLGGHVGYFSILASRGVGPRGRVVIFEPEPGNFDLLCQNLAHHGCDNARPLPVAAWERTTVLDFSVSADNSGGHQVAGGSAQASRRIPAVAIDEVVAADQPVGVVKSDIQGSDHRAMRGAAALLGRHHPDLVVEFWPPGIRDLGDSPAAVVQEYLDLGYRIASALPGHDAGLDSPAAVVAAAEASSEGFLTLVLRQREGAGA